MSSKKPDISKAARRRTFGEGEVLEFKASDGTPWRIEDPSGLYAQYPDLEEGHIPEWVDRLQADPRIWQIFRRLFGFSPTILPPGAEIDDYMPQSRARIMADLGLKPEQLRVELEAAGLRMPGRAKAMESREEVVSDPPVSPRPTTEIGGGDLLKLYQFPEAIFVRDAKHEDWFHGRIREWEPLLKDKVVSVPARSALLLELRILRLQEGLATEDPTDTSVGNRKRYRDLQDDLAAATRAHEALLNRIEESAPWFNVTGQSMDFRAAVSTLVDGIREYRSMGDTALVDGVFTLTEVRVLLRTSVQRTSPQYRLGWVTHVNSAREGLFDPRWRASIPKTILGKLDRGFQAAVKQASDDAGEILPDLTQEDGEYESLAATGGERVGAGRDPLGTGDPEE